LQQVAGLYLGISQASKLASQLIGKSKN